MPDSVEGGFNERKLNTLKQACISTLSESISALIQKKIPADRFLSAFFRYNHKFGSRDRRTISAFIFAYYRWYGCLRKAFRFSDGYPLDDRIIAAALVADRCDSPVLPLLLPNDIPVPGETPFQAIARIAGADTEPSARDLVLDWTLNEVPEDVLDDWLQSMQSRPHPWIRVQNTAPEKFMQMLAKQGIETEQHPVLKNALMLKQYNQRLDVLPHAYRKYFSIQDLSSQGIVSPANPQPGEFWWDFCAGAGGKSLALAAMSRNRISITATDIRMDVLEDLKKRAATAGFTKIITAEIRDAECRKYDGIVTDVPCSSSGRWRRTPDTRFLLPRDWFTANNQTQYDILCRASQALRPNGRIVYGTCSVFRCENQDIIHRFLAEHPDFEAVPFPHPLHPDIMTDGTCLINPSPWDADFAFCALIRRKGRA